MLTYKSSAMKLRFQYILPLLFTSFLICSNLNAQEQPGLRERANQLYTAYKYAEAVPIYLKLADSKKPLLQDLEKLADSYSMMNDYEAAENWYARVIQYPESKAENLIRYGQVLQSNSRYEKAKEVFRRYAQQSGDSQRVANGIAGCDSSMVWMSTPTGHKIINEALVNTGFSEFSAFPVGSNKIFYTAEQDSTASGKVDGRRGKPYLRIFTASSDATPSLSLPLMDQSVYNKGNYHVGPVISNKAGDMLFITRTYGGRKGEVNKENSLKYITHNLELLIYTSNNGNWVATPFPYNKVKEYSVGHAALSPDEKTLYFVSDMPGGLGGTDLWYCELQPDGKWGEPQNAGNAINSTGNEMFPGINGDGTLYYSTNGLPGMGGLDIFYAKGSKNNWSKPVNLRYPVNSAGDDFAYVDLQKGEGNAAGYLSSNRKGGKGGDDIYSFNHITKKRILLLTGTVLNKKTGRQLPAAAVSLYANGRRIVAKQNSDSNGAFLFELDKDQDYNVLAQKETFYSDSVNIVASNFKDKDTIKVVLALEPLLELGKTILIKNIHYDFDKDNIRKDAAQILDELVRVMRDNPTLEIELGSHTDSRGGDAYNLDLSTRRARSVVNYLVGKGIERGRMTARGYGETQLLNHCSNGVKCSSAEHQANRRTEFKITKH